MGLKVGKDFPYSWCEQCQALEVKQSEISIESVLEEKQTIISLYCEHTYSCKNAIEMYKKNEVR